MVRLLQVVGLLLSAPLAAPWLVQVHPGAVTKLPSKDWDVTDDWESLSESSAEPTSSEELYNQDYVGLQALRLGNYGMAGSHLKERTEEEVWMDDIIQDINTGTTEEENDSVELDTESFLDDMGDEISQLVRCNEDPVNLLLAEGRAVPALSEEARDDVSQLIYLNGTAWHATSFMREAVATIFERYASRKIVNGDTNGALVLDKTAIAKWMGFCVDETVGKHDVRVTEMVAKYSVYKTGCIGLDGFVDFYVSAVTGKCKTLRDVVRNQAKSIENVWRDIRKHGMVSPAEWEHEMKVLELKAKLGINTDKATTENIMDECEIMYDSMQDQSTSSTTDRHGRSSHEKVQLVPGTKIPVWLKDGEFVFIDEQSCIGCMQCVTAAPGSFQMLEHNGRARTFFQRRGNDVKTAVSACPVSDCMHYVGYEELVELEEARDQGVSDHHQHFGHSKTRGYIAATPLHVSRRDSDANHRSSFYHYLKNMCAKSSKCPQKGCFDCPKYAPGENPHFKAKLKEATHLRAGYFMRTGAADSFRKTEEL